MPADNDFYRTRKSGSIGGRLLVGVVLLLLIGALAALAWTLTSWKGGFLGGGTDSSSNAAVAETNPAAQATPAPAPGDQAALSATAQPLDARVLDLEQRVIRISVAAQSASGYANRAEAIMVAFAARRALDAGAPLDYLSGQLRLLFEAAQPKAVNTIINAAADPVTVNKLRAGLDDITLLVDQGDPKEGWWSAAMRHIGSLVEIRHAGDPSPEPEQRLARARRAVDSGQIEDAIKEVAALPSQPAVAQWLEQARRYNEAHRALDVIEQAAILEPRTAPVVTAAPAAQAKPEAEKK